MNIEFYERVLVAKYLAVKFLQCGKKITINEAYYYVQQKGDSSSVDMIWLSTVGNYVTWDDHLEDVCCKVLDFKICQPGYSPFTVSKDTLEMDSNYKEWYLNTWLPYIHNLVRKYFPTMESRLDAKIQRGMTDIVSEIRKEINEDKIETLNVF